MSERVPPWLADLSDKELAEKIDEARKNTFTPTRTWLYEAQRRDAQDHNTTIRHLTWAIAGMTAVVTVATVINVVVQTC